MKQYYVYWDCVHKHYFYASDIVASCPETYDRIRKNEPVKKFNRWLDKFVSIQNEEIKDDVINVIISNFSDIKNIHPNIIKNILKLYKFNKYYKMIPTIYCYLLGYRFYIHDELKQNIRKIFCKFVNISNNSSYINYYFFIRSILLHYGYVEMANSIPCINSLEKNYDYMMMWNSVKPSIFPVSEKICESTN